MPLKCILIISLSLSIFPQISVMKLCGSCASTLTQQFRFTWTLQMPNSSWCCAVGRQQHSRKTMMWVAPVRISCPTADLMKLIATFCCTSTTWLFPAAATAADTRIGAARQRCRDGCRCGQQQQQQCHRSGATATRRYRGLRAVAQ